MDKFEYKIKADEMKELIAQGEYEQAAEIADSIDWRRVKSVMMLCVVSDVYKMCRRYEDSRDMLLLAYDRHPGGRTILYSLCELSIKMEDFVQAVEYYKEFVQIAPKDIGKYILQYKLYEAQDVSLEERIAVLEELKKREYREKWAYELAYLYHRVGLATKCVEECDELVLWFGDGKYVIKALELKKLHAPLTAQQQYIYDQRFQQEEEEVVSEAEKSADSETDAHQQSESAEAPTAGGIAEKKADGAVEEPEIQVKTLDVGKYDTINLQEELAAGIQEYFGSNEEAVTRSIVAPMLHTDTIDLSGTVKELKEMDKETAQEGQARSEVFFGETGELEDMNQAKVPAEKLQPEESQPEEVPTEEKSLEELWMQHVQPPKEMAGVLAMEGDGQLSFVLPEKTPEEKQITGQISINDIILEWERLKKENEEKRREDVRQRVLQQTGSLFTEFEAAVRDGLLEKLESGEISSVEEAEADEKETVKEISAEDIGEVEELTEIADIVEAVEAEDIVEDVTDEVPEETSVIAEEVIEEMPEETPVIAEEVIEEMPEEIPVIAEEVIEEMPEEIPVIAEEVIEEVPEEAPVITEPVREKRKVRSMTREERELYGPYIQGRSSMEQIIQAVDGISMAAYTGNVIVTGDEGMDSLGLAKNMIREIQMTDSNFSGKIAKISGETLNERDVKQIVGDLNNGALIIQKAAQMKSETAENLYKVLQQENTGIVVVLEDCKRPMERFLEQNKKLLHCFTSRVDIAALSDDALVSFGKKYAREKEYSIDTMGLLALHTRIAEMQTSDHAVTVMDVKEIMDEAIEHASRKSLGHFFDVLLARRYDEDDMIILKEKDFI